MELEQIEHDAETNTYENLVYKESKETKFNRNERFIAKLYQSNFRYGLSGGDCNYFTTRPLTY